MKPEIKERIDKIKRGEMPDGYKTSKIGVIPEDWDVKHLEDISNINPRKEVLDENDTVSFISMSDVSDDARLISYQPRLYKEVFKGFTSFRDGDVLVAKITPCFENGKGALVDNLINKTGFGSTEFHVLRSKKNGDELFIYYHTVTDRFRKIGEKNMTGTAGQKRISTDFVKGFLIPYPRNDIERKKIASILSTWDKAIELKEKLIEQKKQQKKGLMQKLLTGEVRLPGFEGEWEQVRLGELAKLQGGYAFKSSMFKEKGIPIVRISNILPEITDYNQEFVYYDEIKISDNFMVQYGDILIAMSGATTGKVGIYKKNEIAYLNQRVGKFVNLDKSKLDYGYLYYLVTSTKFKTQLTEELATGAQPNISSKQIENFKFKIPSINEQISISKILAQFDKFISLQEKELIYLKQQKKGLMQLLLTGKVRVKV
ncbi:restriction endonuclease subunit S [Bacillus sp. FSL W8-1127]|jgi:type I restriction enzyme S subunit|uniref:restriction endonuclease subunit S n=1 Tax=unclassified Bacillus (in: firmicutes) TaxID=185979 RepID=UPI0030F506DE